MNIESFWPLAVFAVVTTLSPGGATTLATASGAQFGFRRSLPLLLGIATSLASMAASAAFGLAKLLQINPLLPTVLKTAGTLYLLWLAWKVARAPAPGEGAAAARPISYLGGAWMLWYNPKAWAMTGGAAAAYANLASGPSQLALMLGASFGIACSASLTLWCLAGRELSRRIRTPGHWRLLNGSLAALIVISTIPMWF